MQENTPKPAGESSQLKEQALQSIEQDPKEEHLHQSSEENRETDDQDSQPDEQNETVENVALGLLAKEVPSSTNVELSDTDLPSADDVISFENMRTLCMRDRAIAAAVRQYTDNERKRIERQTPLLIAVIIITAIQVLVFNGIIIYLIKRSFEKLSEFSLLFDLLKYYIGATVVELIGLVVFITKGTFSNDHIKIMKRILGKSSHSQETSELKLEDE